MLPCHKSVFSCFFSPCNDDNRQLRQCGRIQFVSTPLHFTQWNIFAFYTRWSMVAAFFVLAVCTATLLFAFCECHALHFRGLLYKSNESSSLSLNSHVFIESTWSNTRKRYEKCYFLFVCWFKTRISFLRRLTPFHSPEMYSRAFICLCRVVVVA